jgi:hypothetical protein
METQMSTTSNTASAVSTVVHVNNSMQMRPEASNSRRDQYLLLTSVVRQPQEYNGRSNVHAWLAKLEIYLESINREKWTDVTISLLQDDYLKNINDMEAIRKDPYGYERIKQILINEYNEMQHEQATNNKQNKNNLNDFSNRTQKQYESIRSYGDAFIKLAKEAFPNINLMSIDEFLKQNFQRGIVDPNLRLIALEKLNKINLKQDKSFTIEKFIDYMSAKKQAREEMARATEQEYYKYSRKELQPPQQYPTNSSSEHGYRKKHFRNYSNPDQQQSQSNNYSTQQQQRSVSTNSPNNTPHQQRATQQVPNQQQFQPNQQWQSNAAQPRAILSQRGTQSQNTVAEKNTRRNEQIHTYSRVENSVYKHKYRRYNKQRQNRRENAQMHKNSQIKNPVEATPIKGKAIFNNTLVEYLYDGGADRTIISLQTYNQIKQEDRNTVKLEPYNKSLESANGPLDVAGILKLNECILSDESIQVDKPKVIVIKDLKHNTCLLGPDLMSKVPKMKQNLEATREVVQLMSAQVKTKHAQNQIAIEDEQASKIKTIEKTQSQLIEPQEIKVEPVTQSNTNEEQIIDSLTKLNQTIEENDEAVVSIEDRSKQLGVEETSEPRVI